MKKGIVKWILIGLAIVCVLLVVIIMEMETDGSKIRKMQAERFGYVIEYDETRFDFETIRLDERPTYMERLALKNSPYSNYIGVSGIDAEVDLEEVLSTFQSDGSYAFDVQDNATVGSGGYPARKISYTDTEGEEPLQVDYYYLADRGILITVAYDKDHKKELAKVLASLTFTN